MSDAGLIAFAATLFALALAGATLVMGPKTVAQWIFVLGMALLGIEMGFAGLAIEAVSLQGALFWHNGKLAAMAMIPGGWLLFSLCYSRGNYRDFLRQWKWAVTAVLLVGIAAGLALLTQLAPNEPAWRPGGWFIALGSPAQLLQLLMVITAVMILTNLERTFSAAVGTMRWRIKYFVLGLALLFGARVYTASQALLYSAIDGTMLLVEALALAVACLAITFSIVRAKASEVDVYPSQKVLRHSLTALLAGAYLLVIGVLAKVMAALGGDATFPIKALVLLVGVFGLAMLLLSDRLRQSVLLFISRHFRRPLYDYRAVWSSFTGRTTSLLDETELCRAVARLISDTFNVLTVSVWLVDEQRGEFRFVCSTALSDAGAEKLAGPQQNLGRLIQALRENAHPVDIDTTTENWVGILREWNQDYFKKGGNRVVVPLVSAAELVGLITVADRVSGLRFSSEDFDLLKCVGDQVAASLRNIKLSGQLVQAKELEAFQAMSAFVVHDLKNTASSLSLMLQNMSAHFGNPEFREDAIRGLSKSVTHITDLIDRLNLLRQNLELVKADADLSQLAARKISELRGVLGAPVVSDLQPVPKAAFDPDQIEKVLTNLLLNAKDAVGADGEIRVATGRQGGWVFMSVSDDGCGMAPEFVQSMLFKPFRTTKKRGLGIGMFHSKAIVEAHRGRIEVDSVLGKGTTFKVLLPLQDSTA